MGATSSTDTTPGVGQTADSTAPGALPSPDGGKCAVQAELKPGAATPPAGTTPAADTTPPVGTTPPATTPAAAPDTSAAIDPKQDKRVEGLAQFCGEYIVGRGLDEKGADRALLDKSYGLYLAAVDAGIIKPRNPADVGRFAKMSPDEQKRYTAALPKTEDELKKLLDDVNKLFDCAAQNAADQRHLPKDKVVATLSNCLRFHGIFDDKHQPKAELKPEEEQLRQMGRFAKEYVVGKGTIKDQALTDKMYGIYLAAVDKGLVDPIDPGDKGKLARMTNEAEKQRFTVACSTPADMQALQQGALSALNAVVSYRANLTKEKPEDIEKSLRHRFDQIFPPAPSENKGTQEAAKADK